MQKDSEAYHRAMRVVMSTIFIRDEEDAHKWREPTEAEARIVCAALDRSHMLVVPPDVTTRNMGIRKAEERPDAEEE